MSTSGTSKSGNYQTYDDWFDDEGHRSGDLFLPNIAYEAGIEEGQRRERERCAKIARDVTAFTEHFDIGNEIAESIQHGK